MGDSTKYSIAKSRGEDKAADIIFTNTLFFALILSLIYSLCGLFFTSADLSFGCGQQHF